MKTGTELSETRQDAALWRLEMFSNIWMKSWTRRATWLIALTVLLLLAVPSTSAANSNTPPIVVTSSSAVPATGLAGGESEAAVDACGDIYAIQLFGGEVDEIPAGGGAATVVVPAGGANYEPAVMAMDATQSNLYVEQGTNGAIQIPIKNCVPQTASITSIGIGNLPQASNGWGYLSWYFSASAVAADGAGNVFIATDVACCANTNTLVEEYAQVLPAPATPAPYSAGAPLLGWQTNLASPITSIAVDFNNNLYIVMGGSLYELQVTTQATPKAQAVYSSNPVLFGSGYSTNVVGVAVDSQGNLYVADAGNSAIYEIPYETNTTTKTSALNVADQFVVGSNVSGLVYPVAPDGAGNFYYALGGSSVYELMRGGARLGSVAAGTTGTATASVAFNATTTPATFTVTSGDGVVTNAGSGSCSAQTYDAGSSCTVNVQFSPTHPGLEYGGLELIDASNDVLTTAYVSGTGLGAGLTLDSGVVTSIGSGFSSPQSIAVSPSGGFIADSGKNEVLYFATSTSSPVSIGKDLNKPQGVAVDGAGNVIIADTGDNQIVEVPVINGVLTNADQVTIISSTTTISGTALKAPAGVTVDGQGNLLIADTGNNRIVYVPYNGSWNLASAFAVGSDLSAPLATAVDPSGNVYVADSGSGQIYKLLQPFNLGVLQLVAVGFSNPSALATDASGSLFVVDQGANTVLRIPNISGALNPNAAIEVGFGVAAPYGIALDASGNLYATDATHAAAYQLNRISTTESFGDWALNAPSGALPVKVENEGNQALIFNTPFYSAVGNTGDFSFGTPTGAEPACADGGTLATGSACEMDAIFNPTATGNRTDTLALQSNAQNATAPQVILSGVGTAASTTKTALAITSPSGTPSFGQAVTLNATVTSTGGTPAGSAQLLVDGVIDGEATLSSSGVATFSLPIGLTGGSHTLQAVYLGTSSFGGSISPTLSISVSTTSTTSTLAIIPPFTNPNSAVNHILLPVPNTTPQTYTWVPQSVTFTETINFAGVGIPTGTVSFVTGSTSLGTVNLLPGPGGTFQASITVGIAGPSCVVSTSVPTCPSAPSGILLPLGADTITATYSGDANYVGSAASGSVLVVSSPNVNVTTSGASITSSPSSSGTVTFTATSYGGWNGLVGFSCLASSLPTNARCVFSPGQIEVLPSTSTTTASNPPVSLTITIDQPPQTPTASKFYWWLAVPTGLLLFFIRRRFARRDWSAITSTLALIVLGIAAVGMGACSNSIHYNTPAGASTVTVIASSDPFTAPPSSTNANPSTQSCPANNPASAPCAQQTFQVSLTVQ
jgi:sugar lactone lactonase YvrE